MELAMGAGVDAGWRDVCEGVSWSSEDEEALLSRSEKLSPRGGGERRLEVLAAWAA